MDEKITKPTIETVLERMQGMEARLNEKINALDASVDERIRASENRLGERIDGVEHRLNEKLDASEHRLSNKLEALDVRCDRIEALTSTFRAEVLNLTADLKELRHKVSERPDVPNSI